MIKYFYDCVCLLAAFFSLVGFPHLLRHAREPNILRDAVVCGFEAVLGYPLNRIVSEDFVDVDNGRMLLLLDIAIGECLARHDLIGTNGFFHQDWSTWNLIVNKISKEIQRRSNDKASGKTIYDF